MFTGHWRVPEKISAFQIFDADHSRNASSRSDPKKQAFLFWAGPWRRRIEEAKPRAPSERKTKDVISQVPRPADTGEVRRPKTHRLASMAAIALTPLPLSVSLSLCLCCCCRRGVRTGSRTPTWCPGSARRTCARAKASWAMLRCARRSGGSSRPKPSTTRAC